MLKRLSDWLAGYEALMHLCYRLLVLAALAYGLLRMDLISADIAAIADQLDALAEAIAELQDGTDEETGLGTNLPVPPAAGAPATSGQYPVLRRTL